MNSLEKNTLVNWLTICCIVLPLLFFLVSGMLIYFSIQRENDWKKFKTEQSCVVIHTESSKKMIFIGKAFFSHPIEIETFLCQDGKTYKREKDQ